MDRRKVLTWTLTVVALALVGYVTWAILGLFFGSEERRGGSSWTPPSFFPVSSGGVTPVTGSGSSTSTDEGPQRGVPTLRQLSNVPTAGMGAFDKTEGAAGFRAKTTVFRWIERATGHIYEARSTNPTKTRISNTTIPGVQEAFFSDDGKNVVARYLRPDNETIETLVGQIQPVTETTKGGYVYSETKLVTRFLEPGIDAAGDSPREGYFYTLTDQDGGSAVKLVPYATTSLATTIFESPLSQWVVAWVGETLALQSKADSNNVGFLFRAAAGTDGTEKIIGGRSGLTALVNPAGTRAIFSETVGNDLHLWEKNLETGEERLFELRTLPEKCAWSPVEETVVYCGAPDFYVRGAYPTNWYQGRFSFDDNIWQIEVDGEKYKILHDTRTGNETFDVWKPITSPGGEFFLFLNKRDLTLWSLDVSETLPPAGDAAAKASVGTTTAASR